MPLPFILIAGAAAAAAAGIGSGINGGKKMKEANNTMKVAESRHRSNIQRFERKQEATTADMDRLGKLELEILNSFTKFSDIFERIQNRPEFKKYDRENVEIPVYNKEELKRASVGAGVLLGGLGGAAAGTAGGFAAAGATTTAVMALGTASTGTAIASLSGAAATNATLAALGGGAVGSAAWAGGMSLGSAVLGGATLGVGLLVGGLIFNVTGKKLSDKADEAWSQMKRAEKEIDTICDYLIDLSRAENKFENALKRVNQVYRRHLKMMGDLVILRGKTNWSEFAPSEQALTENTVLLVGLLYEMCKVKIVKQSTTKDEVNKINDSEINNAVKKADTFLHERGLSGPA